MLDNWSFARFGGFGGIGFALMIVACNLILEPAGMPAIGAEISEVGTYFTDQAVAVQIGSAGTPIAWLSVVIFGAAAVSTLWPAERATRSAWSLVGFAGLILQSGVFVLVTAARLALSATSDTSPTATAGLWALHNALFTLNGTFLAMAMLGFSLAGLRTGLLHRWHGVLGLVAAALQFANALLTAPIIDHSGPLALIGLIGWLMWIIWIVAYGVTLIRLRPDSATTTDRVLD